MLDVAIIYSNEFIVENGYSEQTLNHYFLLLLSELSDYWFQTYLTTELGRKIFVETRKLAPKFGARYVTSLVLHRSVRSDDNKEITITI